MIYYKEINIELNIIRIIIWLYYVCECFVFLSRYFEFQSIVIIITLVLMWNVKLSINAYRFLTQWIAWVDT